MAHCTKCGAQVDAGAAYCQVCGERQPAAAHGAASPASHSSTASGTTNATPGTTQPAATPSHRSAAPGAQSGLSENVAATLSYALGWVTGLIFLLIDKRPYVQFHAAQSLVVFAGLALIRSVVRVSAGLGFGLDIWDGWGDWDDWGFYGWGSVTGVILGLIRLLGFILWLVLMVKAYQGERFRVPVAADLAESIAGKPTLAA
ncbi:MAG: zinc-ribbon domain-containing protein [Candidatus Acidiferrales bacterium]